MFDEKEERKKIKRENLKVYLGFGLIAAEILGLSYGIWLAKEHHNNKQTEPIAPSGFELVQNDGEEQVVKKVYHTEYIEPSKQTNEDGEIIYVAPSGWTLFTDENGKKMAKRDIITYEVQENDISRSR